MHNDKTISKTIWRERGKEKKGKGERNEVREERSED
jgi:hypothetical protein